MGIELGRISGPLLASNLLRDGTDLQFENDLLYLSVTDPAIPSKVVGIGINTSTPVRLLTIDGKTLTTNLIVDTLFETNNQFSISTNRIQNVTHSIIFTPDQSTDPQIQTARIGTKDYSAGINYLNISDRLIENLKNNSDINFTPNGNGRVVITTNQLYVDGQVRATGNITWDGTIIFGNNDADSVTFKSDVASHIIPDITNFYDLGAVGKAWKNVYSIDTYVGTELISSGLSATTLTVNGAGILRSTIVIGDSPTDTVTIPSKIAGHLIPTIDREYTLGNITDPSKWDTAFLSNLDVDGILTIDSNQITIVAADTDLSLAASGSGIVNVTTTDVEITNDLEVKQLTTLSNLGITGLLDLTGDYTWTQTGTTHRIGNTDITGSISVLGAHIVQFDDIQFSGNILKTTLGTNLELTANGTGIVKTLTSNVEITNDLKVDLVADIAIVNALTVTANAYDIGSVYIIDNSITTNVLDTNLVLSADNLGEIHVTTTDVVITNDLEVNQLTTLADVGITGLLSLTGDYTWTQTGTTHRIGNTDITGSLTVNGANTVQFDDIQIRGNTVKTTLGTNLELQAAGTGIVKTLTSDVEITNDLDVGLYGYFNNLDVGAGVFNSAFTVGDFYISNNDIITTVGSNIDIILEANGAGLVYVPTNDVNIANNLTVTNNVHVDGNTSLQVVEIGSLINPSILTQTGNIDQTGNTYITGNFNNNNITVLSPSYISVPDIKIESNIISVTATNTDLEIFAAGTGGVQFDRRLKITDNVISNIFDTNNIELAFDNILAAEDLQLLITEDGDVYLADTKADRDLSIIFEPNGIGNMIIDSDKALALAYGSNLDRILELVGEIRQNSVTGLYEGYTPGGLVSFNNIYDSDRNTYITPELTPGYNDNKLRFFSNGNLIAYIDTSKLFANELRADNVKATGNILSNSNTSLDLEILPTGVGSTIVNNVSFKDDAITNNTNDALIIESTGNGYVKFNGTKALVIPAGNDIDRRVAPELGETRYNLERSYLEVWNGSDWVAAAGTSSVATEEEIVAETNLWAILLG